MPPYYSAYNGNQVDSAVAKTGLLTTLSSLTGGGENSLDAVATVSLAVGARAFVLVGDSLFPYLLVEGTTAEAAPDYIRPDDYAASTNEKVWKLLKDLPAFVSGAVDIDEGESQVVVTGLGLASAPRVVVPILQIPDSGGLGLVPIVLGSPTVDGFVCHLQGGPTDSVGYRLNYLIFL